jgi:hypothetical protein
MEISRANHVQSHWVRDWVQLPNLAQRIRRNLPFGETG